MGREIAGSSDSKKAINSVCVEKGEFHCLLQLETFLCRGDMISSASTVTPAPELLSYTLFLYDC